MLDEEIEDDIKDTPEEAIRDNLSPAESEAIHDAINQVIAVGTTTETAVKLSGKQFRSQRLRSKKAFEQDSRTKECSRPDCPDKKGCYDLRKAKYLEKNTSTLSSNVQTRSFPETR